MSEVRPEPQTQMSAPSGYFGDEVHIDHASSCICFKVLLFVSYRIQSRW